MSDEMNKDAVQIFLVRDSRAALRMTPVFATASQEVLERARTTIPMTPVQAQTVQSPAAQAQPQPTATQGALKKD